MKRTIFATDTQTTTSGSDITIPQLTQLIPQGIWFVIASCDMQSNANTDDVSIVINLYSNGVLVPGSEKSAIIPEKLIGTQISQSVVCFSTIELSTPTVVESRTRSTSATLTMLNRSISYIKMGN